MPWTFQDKNDFARMMGELWPRWAEVHPRKQAAYYYKLEEFPMPCVEAGLHEIVAEQTFSRVPEPAQVAAAARAQLERWRESHPGQHLSQVEADWRRLCSLGARIEGKDGGWWSFHANGLLNEATATMWLRANMKPGHITFAINRAKQSYGYPFPEVVYVDPNGKEVAEVMKKFSGLIQKFGAYRPKPIAPLLPHREPLRLPPVNTEVARASRRPDVATGTILEGSYREAPALPSARRSLPPPPRREVAVAPPKPSRSLDDEDAPF